MSRESTRFALGGEKDLGLRPNRHHIGLQLHHHAAIIAQIMPTGCDKWHFGGKAGIQPDLTIIVCQHTRIKRELFSTLFPQVFPFA